MLPPSEQQGQVTGDAAELSHVVAGARDRERLRTVVVPDHDDLARRLADRIVAVVARATAERERCVLGLATGSTPLGIYRELIRRHRAGEVDFARVVAFNLDEYYPMPPDSPHSYRRYMWENLFAHVNIRPEHVHIPDGSVPQKALAEYCDRLLVRPAVLGERLTSPLPMGACRVRGSPRTAGPTRRPSPLR